MDSSKTKFTFSCRFFDFCTYISARISPETYRDPFRSSHLQEFKFLDLLKSLKLIGFMNKYTNTTLFNQEFHHKYAKDFL